VYKVNEFLTTSAFLNCSTYSELKSTPFGCIDVGSRGGFPSYLDPIAGSTAVLAFEPDDDECATLREQSSALANFEVSSAALSASSKKSLFHILKRPINNSLFTPNFDFAKRYSIEGFAIERIDNIETVPIDNVLQQMGLNPFRYGELIKLDVQGAELEVLSGAIRLLNEVTVAAVIEVEFCELYASQPLFPDVDRFMRDQGFSFYGFMDLSYRSAVMRHLINSKGVAWKERLIAGDAVYFKDPFDKGWKGDFTTRNHHALFVAALILGYFDFATELLKLHVWENDDRKSLISFIEQMATRG
jgi:FkbM family methyltransferase